MPNELRHEDTATGTTLKRTDWEDVDNHRFDSQAQGDMLIATSVTQLSRLGITNDRILVSSGGLFSWSDTLPAFTLGGTVTLGGQAFDAGAGSAQINTTGTAGLLLQTTRNDTQGARLQGYQISTSPAVDDWVLSIQGKGRDLGANEVTYGYLVIAIEDPADGANDGKIDFRTRLAGGDYLAMTLSSAGGLWVAADIDFSTSIDSALVADHVSLGCFDIGGLRSLAISQENPVVVAAAGASDEYLPIRINGVTYKLLLHS